MDLNEIRYKIYECVKEELLGPGSEQTGLHISEEIITDKPSNRYSTGILFTKFQDDMSFDYKQTKGKFESEEIINDEYEVLIEQEKENMYEEENFESKVLDSIDINDEFYEEMNNAHIMRKSSMGLTFFLNKSISNLTINIKAARYRPTKISECMVFYDGDLTPLKDKVISTYIFHENKMLKIKDRFKYDNIKQWEVLGLFEGRENFKDAVYKLYNQCKHKNASYKRRKIELNGIKLEFNEKNQTVKILKDTNLKVFAIKRKYENKYGITVMLINEAEGNDETKFLFQPQIIIDSKINGFLFVESNNLESNINPKLDLLYRNKKSYGIGHGVSVDFNNINSVNGIGQIATEYMPIYEVPNTNFEVKQIVNFDILSMLNLSDLSELSRDELINGLLEFVQNYDEWIQSEIEKYSEIEKNMIKVAEENIGNCEVAKDRMLEGINLLKTNNEAFLAFQFTNKAMLIQRLQSNHKKNIDSFKGFNEYKKFQKSEARWRGFQLAFILMIVSSITQKDNKFRNIVDLIWIPTGGGKTEAYLGASAFTIFYRRLTRGKHSYGTTIIMRYTLRLLAAQQFERAAKLICACEYIRKESNGILGDEEISIGLWIGSEQTPNTVKEASKVIEKLKKDRYSENKFQILRCPWCGEPLIRLDNESKKNFGYRYNRGRSKKISFQCQNEDCYFESGIPVQVIDECLYLNPPTLLFSTVDKFAMLPWKSEAGTFFGHNSENDCPELIIQDELHLISGPLGSLVGQFETVVDYLCSIKGVKPKIIASTATICEANNQVHNLYNRDVIQFPPPGVNIEDSFFIKEENIKNKPGRLYVGISGVGQTQITTEVRLFAAILQRISQFDIPDEEKDKYWTLVSYFNSIRELGKAATLVYDDVKDYMIRISGRTGNFKDTRRIYSARELTSRKNSSEIVRTLNDLEKVYPDKGAVNILLATNMISVGVDVSRMNIMSVIGQPKLTSEYIQASSRVGRKDPGIVFTLYDSRKSRDESHYEIFQSYHQGFYKYVEPTSITPFSEPAMERMLHSVFIAMVRHSTTLNSEESAKYFNPSDKEIIRIIEYIVERGSWNELIDKKLIENILNTIINKWTYKKEIKNENMMYTKGSNPLMNRFYKLPEGTPGFNTMTSMRNVDGEIRIKVLESEE